MKQDDDKKDLVDQREFRKANEIISPRVARGGTLTLLSRKVFNVLLYHTQRLGVPGKDAPEGDPLFADFFWIPLHELAADSAYNSEDASVIKDALQRLQDIKIITDDKKGFASDVLIPNIRVIPNRRGKATMVGWKLDATTERILKTPELYTRLSIYYLTSLRSTFSIALYEMAKRYSTNPSGLTARENWEWWHDVLTGLPITHEKPEYKYFKRDVLKTAIDEVNTTDIQVDLIEHKIGRKVAQLQFRVASAKQTSLELPLPPVVNSAVIEKIRAIGINAREAEDIFASHDEHLILKTLQWVDQRVDNHDLPPVESPAALFRAALRGRYAESAQPKQKVKRLEVIKKEEVTPDPEKIAAREAAIKQFNLLSAQDQQMILGEFVSTLKGPAAKAFKTKGLDHPLTGPAFSGWLMANSIMRVSVIHD